MAYFPNGSAGEVLDMQCADCPLGFGWHNPSQAVLFDAEPVARQCPTHIVQMLYNYDQIGIKKLEDAMNVLIAEDGTCQTREALVQIRRDEEQKRPVWPVG